MNKRKRSPPPSSVSHVTTLEKPITNVLNFEENGLFQISALPSNEKSLVISLSPSQAFQFYGSCKVTLIHGALNIAGCRLDVKRTSLDCIAPLTSPPLTIVSNVPIETDIGCCYDESLENDDSKILKKLCSQQQTKNVDNDEKKQNNNTTTSSTSTSTTKNQCFKSVFILSEFKSKSFSSAEWFDASLLSQTIPNQQENILPFFERIETIIPVRFCHCDEALPDEVLWRSFDEWLETQNLGNAPAVVVVGRQSVGKSTACRRVVNRLLQQHERVRWLDADVGQAEFTAPGVVSLHDIDAPLLGEALTHACHLPYTAARFFGSRDATPDPDALQAQLCDLVRVHNDAAQTSERDCAPLVVNTAGWTVGIGLDVLHTIVDAIHTPTVVLEVRRKQETSYSSNVDRHEPTTLAQRLCRLGEYRSHAPRHAFTLDVGREQHVRAPLAINAQRRRRAMLLRHLGNSHDLTQWRRVTVRRVAFANVRVYAGGVAPSLTLRALNGAVVALCHDPLTYEAATQPYDVRLLAECPRLAQCLSLALVRGIDAQQQLFYIATPLDDNALTRVNTLVLGSIALPPMAIAKSSSKQLQSTTSQRIPYVVHESIGNKEPAGGLASNNRQVLPRRSQRKQN